MGHALQVFKAEFSQELLLVIWCASHKVDLVAKGIDDQPAAQNLLRLVRRLCSHISASSYLPEAQCMVYFAYILAV